MTKDNFCTISELNRINFDSEEDDIEFEITNPISGKYKDIENDIYKILEINRDVILKIWDADDSKTIYLTNNGISHSADRAYMYIFYEEKDIKNWANKTQKMLLAKDWDLYRKQYLYKDMIVYGARRK